jgi:uncharacterized protein
MVGKVPKKNPRRGVDEYGRTPRHYAAADDNATEVHRLLAEGASPDAQDDNGWTPAHFAAQAGSFECMGALLGAGADPALADSYGNTVLWRAVFASKGEGELIHALRAAGADPTPQTNTACPRCLSRAQSHRSSAHISDCACETP